MALALISKGTSTPVSLQEIKAHLRLDATDTTEDAWLTAQLVMAQEQAENDLNISLTDQQWDCILDEWPRATESGIALRAPLTAVEFVEYRQQPDGEWAEIASTDYEIDSVNLPGWVNPMWDMEWPTDIIPAINCIRVRFKCGYTTPEQVPQPIRFGIMTLVGEAYENREASAERPVQRHEFIGRLFAPYRVPNL